MITLKINDSYSSKLKQDLPKRTKTKNLQERKLALLTQQEAETSIVSKDGSSRHPGQ